MSSSSATRVFPLPAIPLPFTPHSNSRRIVRRFHQSVNITSLANRTIQALNTLNISFSTSSPLVSSSIDTASSKTRNPRLHSRLLAHIYSCATRFHRCHSESSSASSDDILYSPHLDSSFSYSSLQATALPIVASRVSLPSSVGSADLLNLLPLHLHTMYSSPQTLLRPSHEVKRTRKPVLFASPSEYTSLIHRMYILGMIEFTQHPKVVNGVFGVPKDGDSIRLIIDARPANAVFIDPPKVHLPTPDLLSQMIAPAHQPFFVAKVDLDNFYHRLTLPSWLRPYFALPSIRACDVGLGGVYGSDTFIYPCCKTLPMGWSHSVFIAQAAHEHLLDTQTNLSPQHRITHDNDLKLDRARHQVYIDDLNLFGPDPNELAQLQKQYISAAESVGLPVKPSKVVLPSDTGVECLGLTVNGSQHEVGLSISKLVNLRSDTVRLLSSNECTGVMMSQIVGKWTWAALVSRPLLSVFSAVYRFIECAGYRQFTIWNSVRRELSMMIDLAPLFFTKLSSEWFDRLVATDASNTGQGVVAVKTSTSNPFETEAAKQPTSCKWSTIISSPWSHREHINSLEIRAVSSAIKWILSFPHSISRRVGILSDSLVAIFSITKGRSSSPMLLPRLRQLASSVLASGLRLYLSWIPSEYNPADAPSRADF
jgi:hypothetical protein